MGSPAGVALGVDRLVMRLTGADSISAVRAPE
jgi:elongation factor P--beta-lysine ligase